MLRLIAHPDLPPRSVEYVGVTASLESGGAFWIRYYVEIPEYELEIGHPGSPVRTDGLWQSTCFEAFVAIPRQDKYFEFNFAPSSQWAAYSFDNYRSAMADLETVHAPEISLDASTSHFALEASLILPDELAGVEMEIALTAVIEEASGAKSYWSLKHPPGRPDFHHRDCFALRLGAGKAP